MSDLSPPPTECSGVGHDHDHDASTDGAPWRGGSHGHAGHSHGPGLVHAAGVNLGIAFGLNLVFTIIEFAGGYWTNSIAITTDAVHDLGDCLSLGLAWGLQLVSRRPRSPRYTYGMGRLSPLGAFITGMVLITGLLYVASVSLERLWSPEPVAAPQVMLIALLGLAFNGYAAWRLHGGMTLNEQVASWHLWEDTLGWAAVLVGGAVMSLWHIPIVDPLLAIGLALFVLWNVARNLRRVAEVFLQAVPEGVSIGELEALVQSVEGVQSVSNLHAWTLDSERHVLTVRVTCSPETVADLEQVKARIREKVGRLGFDNVTIET
ncbi:MAG: cation transporter [Planctomyces sp.]|nr:cation transporter [Planctomyces sp.]